MERGAPKPPDGVSFDVLVLVRQTPRMEASSPLRTPRRRLGKLPGEKWVKEPPPAWACSQSAATSTAGRAEARDPLCQDSSGYCDGGRAR